MTGIFAGKIALVTGAASGIGRATARALAAEGAGLILLDVDAAGLDAVHGELGGVVRCVDLADPVATECEVRSAVAEAGGIDILCNVAGVSPQPDTVLNAEHARWVHLLSINLIAPALLMRIAAEDMIARGSGGRIVNVSSSSAFRAQSPACYASAKSGLLGLTRAGAAKLGEHGINVNAVVPGVTATAMTLAGGEEMLGQLVKSEPLKNLTGRVSQPEDVASAIVYLCRPESRQITGQAIHTSAGAVV